MARDYKHRKRRSGKAGGGPYYVQQYLREQSRTVIEELVVMPGPTR